MAFTFRKINNYISIGTLLYVEEDESRELFIGFIAIAELIVWNVAAGVFEFENFSHRTRATWSS